jgi:hypothetical protein
VFIIQDFQTIVVQQQGFSFFLILKACSCCTQPLTADRCICSVSAGPDVIINQMTFAYIYQLAKVSSRKLSKADPHSPASLYSWYRTLTRVYILFVGKIFPPMLYSSKPPRPTNRRLLYSRPPASVQKITPTSALNIFYCNSTQWLQCFLCIV